MVRNFVKRSMSAYTKAKHHIMYKSSYSMFPPSYDTLEMLDKVTNHLSKLESPCSEGHYVISYTTFSEDSCLTTGPIWKVTIRSVARQETSEKIMQDIK